MSDRPTVRQLTRELADVVDIDGLGIALGVSDNKIRGIKLGDQVGGVNNWKISLFGFWLRSDDSPSWEKVISALEEIGDKQLAKKLQNKYLNSQEYESDDPPPSKLTRRRHDHDSNSSSNGGVTIPTSVAGGGNSSRCYVGLFLLVIVVVGLVAGMTFWSTHYDQSPKKSGTNDNGIPGPTDGDDQNRVKQSTTNCKGWHKIVDFTTVYLFLKDHGFSYPDTYNFGLYLNLSNSELTNLKEDSGGKSSENFFNKVLDKWYKKNQQHCWKTIYNALTKIPNVPLANEVKQEYMKN